MSKLGRLILIAIISAISGALIAYLKDDEKRAKVAKLAKEYTAKLEKKAKVYSKKAKKLYAKKLKEYKL